MTRKAILAGGMLLPTESIDVRTIKNRLSVRYRRMGDEEASVVRCYQEKRGFLSVPRQYGLLLCDSMGIEVQDRMSYGTPVTFPKFPKPRNSQQREFVDGLVDGTQQYYDFLARAHTGFGKTICALMAAARIGVTTLVIVDQDNLKDQWLSALSTHFGMTIENGHVGIVQGQTCDFEGRSVVIAMIQTLSQKRFTEELYRWAGLLIVDEYHTIGAPTFSTPLLRIAAAYRFGVSATPRKDDLKKVLAFHLGEIAVAADKQHEESSVYFAQHPTVYSWYANISPKIGRILSEVAEDGSRNLLLAEGIKWLYESGRDTIVLSDRIEQLKHLSSLCKYLGIDSEVMGLYTGEHPKYKYAKDATPRRKPIGLVQGAAYTPVSLQLIAKTVPAKKLAEVKQNALIQFATYGKAGKGYDVPRLSGGVDASPRSKAEQIHGRILREEEGKLSPIWFTVEDTGSYRLVRSFALRAQEYVKSNARIYHWIDGELEEWQLNELTRDRNATVKHLQSLRIETLSDGRNTLLTKASEMQRKLEAVRAIVRRVRSRNPD